MAQKAVVPAKKASAPAKKTTGKGVKKGDYLACEVCGFAVTVDEVCDCAEVHEILCCEQPMKPKAKPKARAKTPVKAAAKKTTAKAK
jgi:hypothetical protein